LQLNYWTGSRCTRATFDEDRGQWTIDVTRAGEPQTITARHLVIATGMSGYPNMPAFEGDALFEGPRVHSSDYRGGRDFRGQRVAVIGSNTSAHDICQDLWEHDAEVTMIQRSGTLVTQSETVLECLLGGLYSEDALDRGIDTETADFIGTTWPHRLVERRMKDVCTEMRRRDADLHDRLSRAGFLHDFGPDETGLPLKSIRQGGGFYINVGASELIADGEVALKPGRSIQALERDGLRLDDGHKVEADAIIYATGYRSMNEFVADIVGRAVADEVGRCWGVGSGVEKDPGPWEGELRNMWKPTAHPALWFQGGNLAQSRHFSRFLALQIKARLEGIASDVWHRPGTSTGAHPEQQPARRSASLREPQTA
ncbi:MAG: NAD(P)/FAD-dependent oxidoreductase, partial [Pseudomonadota bacterium]